MHFWLSNKLNVGTTFALLLLCTFATDVTNADGVKFIGLNTNWTVTNGSFIAYQQNLPSGAYSAYSNEEVLFGYNDELLRWLAYDNWTYTNNFQLDLTQYTNVRYFNLTFHGIDTIAEIILNQRLLGRTDNMFVRYSFDVTDVLKEDNVLEVRLTSPVLAAKAKAQALAAANLTAPPNCPHERYHGECHMNMLRKMQASFSWDWGLAAPSQGLWKHVELELYEVAFIRDIDVDVTLNETHWNMNITCFLDASINDDFNAELVFYAVELHDKPIVIDTYIKQPISRLSPVIVFDQAFPIEKVVRWWPNGSGEQKLYPLHFTLNAWVHCSRMPDLRARTTSQKSINYGFRTLELIEQPAPGGDGNTFLFRVNGVPIFMKGSNYIPSHILPELQHNPNSIGNLLQSAKDAHMNMIRVWGGGVYESDLFYDMTDRLGLLVWQDMMFACAMYPVGDEFLSSVRTEVVQNAKRLSHHASVAVFATNNENEVALVQNWYQTLYDLPRFQAEYRELYLGTVIHELKLVSHHSRPEPLVSSPSNGVKSAEENYISANPQSPYYGDVHFYDYFKDAWDPLIYPRPRFASEYGLQSLPGMYAWQSSKSEDQDLMELINHRQHHPLGMVPLITQVRRHLPLPLSRKENYAQALIYFSQITQAMAMKIETELYRSLRDTNHRTMGALYWQLNDIWVAPSWSGIDFYGNWKLLHYWAREFLAPISIVALYDKKTESLNISLICDQLAAVKGDITVVANTYLWSKLLPSASFSWKATLRTNGVQNDKVILLADLLHYQYNLKNAFLEFQLYQNDKMLAHTYYFPSSIAAAVGVGDPELEFELSTRNCVVINGIAHNSVSITITIKRPAIFVYIEVQTNSRYKLSENGFMQTTPVHVVYLETETTSCLRPMRKKDLKVLTVNQFMVE